MNKEEFIKVLQNNNISVEDAELLTIKINNADEKSIIKYLDIIYEYENTMDYNNVILNLKGLPINVISSAIKYSLNYENLNDSIMLLNIINLIKTYNNLQDSFFSNENIYVSSIEELLDLKLTLKKDLQDFSKKLSIYFISLFKTYPKSTFSPTDVHIKLPDIYANIIMSTDLYTLSGIFSFSETFDTKECVYIDEAFKYISTLLMKNSISMAFFNTFNDDVKEEK